MSELPRRLVSQIRRYIGNRRGQKRVYTNLPFTLSLSDPRTSSNGFRRLPSLTGHTLDVSTTGIALVVPAIRIGEHYLAGTERPLHLKLELPDGPVEMHVKPVRYESLEDEEETGYVIGAQIMDIEEAERDRFEKFVRKLLSTAPG